MKEQIYCRYCGRKLHRSGRERVGTDTDEYGKVHLKCAERLKEKERR